MITFWDTSALLPLILNEVHSRTALEIWNQAEESWAWDWALIEAEAGLARQNRPPENWQTWLSLSENLHCVGLQDSQYPTLRMMNRSLKLRAADAGHVYVFDRLRSAIPELTMVTFDQEMITALESLSLSVHSACRL